MGIAKGAAKIILKEVSRRPFAGRLLTLGRLDIWFSYDLLQKMAKEFGVKLSTPDKITLAQKSEFAAKGYISDGCFFKSLGFSEVKALDFSDYESACCIFDLNNDKVPEYWLEAFDVIYDGGTIEHVFHIPNVLNNIYKMLRQGGRIFHFSPASNYIDHGFYMFSPTLFYDFYKTNKFEINNFQIFRHTPRHEVEPWQISDYTPGCLNPVSFGGLDDGMYGVICIATKTRNSTGDKVPQQSIYINMWNAIDKPSGQEETSKISIADHSKLRPIKDAIKRFPLLCRILRRLVRFMQPRKQHKGLGLKVVARY